VSTVNTVSVEEEINVFPNEFQDEVNTCDVRKLSHNFCQWITLLNKKKRRGTKLSPDHKQSNLSSREGLRHTSAAFRPVCLAQHFMSAPPPPPPNGYYQKIHSSVGYSSYELKVRTGTTRNLHALYPAGHINLTSAE
jgi:hypothetical protein